MVSPNAAGSAGRLARLKLNRCKEVRTAELVDQVQHHGPGCPRPEGADHSRAAGGALGAVVKVKTVQGRRAPEGPTDVVRDLCLGGTGATGGHDVVAGRWTH